MDLLIRAIDKTLHKLVHFSQAVVLDRTVFVSGVLGMDAKTNKLVDGGAIEEARQALKNIGAILDAAGSSYEKVVKTTILLNDIGDFGAVNEVYKECNVEPVLFLPANFILGFFRFPERISSSLHFSSWEATTWSESRD